MSRPHFKIPSVWELALVAVLLGTAGYQEKRDSYSCAVCRNLKEDKTVRFFWVPLFSSSRTGHAYVIPLGHRHDWFHYSYFEMLGVRGWMMARVGCAPQIYRDNKMPGYNAPEPERA